jgi:phosphoglycolate phosphatase-like HAD superfamily hydrolase
VTDYIIPRIRADFPGVTDAIRLLHSRGYTLHTASGAASYDLAGYLEGMGVRDCFTILYGPDLINTFKTGPHFYHGILAHSQVDPADALIIDDSRHAIAWAAEAGLRGVLVTPDGSRTSPHAIATISGLSELPALLETL